AFYPGDNTAVCTAQLCSYQADLAVFADLDATLWGISTQGIASHEKFAEKRGLTFPLLADTDKSVHRQYGALLPVLGTRRAVFVIDAGGIVRWRHVSTVGLTYQGVTQISDVLRSIAV
ncbi:MAG TPA: peroxiredoxin, partial [Mycobacteriales bacterium]|nr:peroxiredoxin [Mycobacteriales bacterium]